MFFKKMSKQKKRELLNKLGKRSILFKPFVWSRLYRLSSKVRKNAVNEALVKYTNFNNLSKYNKKRTAFYSRPLKS